MAARDPDCGFAGLAESRVGAAGYAGYVHARARESAFVRDPKFAEAIPDYHANAEHIDLGEERDRDRESPWCEDGAPEKYA